MTSYERSGLALLEVALALVTGDEIPQVEIPLPYDAATQTINSAELVLPAATLIGRLATLLAEQLGTSAVDVLRALHLEYRVDEILSDPRAP